MLSQINLIHLKLMGTLKKEYRDLETRVLSTLREMVNNSKTESKHLNGKAIKVNVFDYTEIVIINDRLIFLDSNGYHYSLFNGDCTLEDLIDIIEKHKS